MRLRIKLGLALLTGVVLSLALVVHAALDMFDRELRAVKTSHFGFMVDEIAHAITVRTDLGLRLETIPEIAALLDRTQASESDIDRLLVFGADGRVVFSTDQTDLGTMIEMHDLGARRTRIDEQAVTVGSPLVNNFGKVVGGVLLESEVSHGAPLRERAAVTVFGIAAGVLAACLLLVFLSAGWVLRPLLGLLRQGDAALLAMAEGRPADPEGVPPTLAGFHGAVSGIVAGLDADAREVDRLDRIG